jgi:hypothetical protein
MAIKKIKSACLITALGVCLLCGCRGFGEVNFCRATFIGLFEGKAAIEENIDWNNFVTPGLDIGNLYRQQADDQQRKAFRKAFIAKAGEAFKTIGGKARYFSDWRLFSQDKNGFVVAATYKRYVNAAPTIFIIVRKGARLQVTGFNWERP